MNDIAITEGPLVSVRNLQVRYAISHAAQDRLPGGRAWLNAVDGVDLDLLPGETLGLVGESGCGKSTLGRALLGLRPISRGQVLWQGRDLATLGGAGLKALRRQAQLVFQDPYASLNPRERAGDAVRSGLDIHDIGSRADRERRVAELFELVGLSPDMRQRWPHEFSGGQRQRIVIARALALQPRLLVCDEPVSALDVSIQAQVLNLLRSLQQHMGLTLLFVSHNLGVIDHMSDRIAVMYRGRIVEQADRDALLRDPQHPYTRALLAAVPLPDPRRRLSSLPPPASAAPVSQTACPYATRCEEARAECSMQAPSLRPMAGNARHQVACWLVAA